MKLLPHYDLLSTAVYAAGGEHINEELSQPLGNARNFGQVTREDVLVFAQELRLSQRVAEREIDKLCAQIQQEADELIAQIEALPVYEQKAGELQLLRNIRYRCIGEFVAQIT